jgi:PQQ-dependent catabolism-associated beta-propeller protein
MRVAILVALIAVIVLPAPPRALHIQILGTPTDPQRQGIELGVAEMSHTAGLVGAAVTVSDRWQPTTVGTILAGRVSLSHSAVPVIHLGRQSAGPAEARCSFRLPPSGPPLWSPMDTRFGASELNDRFRARFQQPMTSDAWHGWIAVKALVESALRAPAKADLCDALVRARFDGHKGTPLFFDPRTRVLRQPDVAVPLPPKGGSHTGDNAGRDSWLPPLGGSLVFVSNEVARNVAVIDTATDRVVRTIAVDGRPRGLEARGGRLYVALSDTDRERRGQQDAIVAVDIASGKIVQRFAAGTDPERFVLSPDGRRLYAANEDAGTATVIDVASNRVLATLVVGVEPEGIAISPDGRWVYVTAETSNTLSVIDTAKLKVVSSLLVQPRPRDVTFSPDGTRAYATAEIGGSVAVVDTGRHKAIDTIVLPGSAKPVGAAVSPDGRTLFVANGHANSVAVIDTASRKVLATVPTGRRPWGVALSADGRRLYTANGVSGDVSVIDTATRREVKRIQSGAGAWGVALVR